MESTIGKALRDARLKKGWTLEQVAQMTKIRRDWLADLEEENYLRFPSLAYARSFQILYAKHLELDLSKIQVIEAGKPTLVTSFDHLYDGITPVGYRGTPRKKPIRRSRWVAAFIIFSAASAIGAVTALFILDILRLPTWEEMTGEGKPNDEVMREAIIPSPTPTPTPEPTPEPTPTPSATPKPLEPVTIAPLEETIIFQLVKSIAPPEALPETLPSPSSEALPADALPTEATEATDAAVFSFAEDVAALATPFPSDFADDPDSTAAPEATASPAPPAPPAKEIEITTTRRTRVKVYLDDPKAPAAHNVWLEPGKPLTVSGERIWIESQNRHVLKVTSAGAPVALPTGSTRGKFEIQ